MIVINPDKKALSTDVSKLENRCTVLMSTYNGHEFIERQIISILNQKNVLVHLVVRDDGSNDETVSIIERISKDNPGLITLFKGTNKGIHRSFRELILEANSSDFISFADQDDVWDLDKLEIAIKEMKKHNSHFYSCSSRLVDECLKETESTTADEAVYGFYMKGNSKILTPGCQGCTMVITNELRNLLIERKIPDYYGHDTWITIVAYYIANSIYDPVPHMSYRQHNNSWTGNRTKKVKQKIIETRFFIKGLKRYKPLANDVLSRYSDFLSETDKIVLSAIGGNRMSIAERFKALITYKFGKKGTLSNIVFSVYYLFCWK